MKKFTKIFACVLILLFSVVLITPFVVDLNKYHHLIVENVNKRINGKLELGKLSLSLWGRIKVEIEGLKVSDAQGTKILEVNDAYFHVPLLSLLKSAPILNLNMQGAKINVVKDESGRLNLLRLLPENTKEEAASKEQAPHSEEKPLPSFVKNMRVSLEFLDAELDYKDLQTKTNTHIKDLNLKLHDMSLTHPMEMEFWADLNTQLSKDMTLKGLLRIEGNIEPRLLEGKLAYAHVKVHASFNQLIVDLNGSVEFVKNGPKVNFEFKSNDMDLAPWATLIPMIKEKELSGKLTFSGKVHNPKDTMDYHALFALNLKAPGTDANIQGRMQSISEQPSLDLQLQSSVVDVNALLGEPKPATTVPSSSQASSAAPPQSKDLDKELDALRSNPMLQKMVARVGININQLKKDKIKLEKMTCQIQFKDLALDANSCGFGIFSGSVLGSLHAQLKPASPNYQFKVQVSNLEVREAMESQFELLKNSVHGLFNFSMQGQGTSLNTKQALSKLQANGKLHIKDAKFASIDVSKMVAEGVNGSLKKVSDKIPALNAKTANLDSYHSTYESITGDFSILNSQFETHNFFAKAKRNEGFDIKGMTKIGLNDESLDASWELLDTYNLTRLADLSVEQSGVKVEHIPQI